MDLDLLKKLVKLANNNSNEHEANSAARRVCKMIAENNFEIAGGDVKSQPRTTGRTAYDVVNDYMRQRYGGGGASQQQQNEWTGFHYGSPGYDPSYANKQAQDKAYQQTQEAKRRWEEERKEERAAYEAQERARRKAREEDKRYWENKEWDYNYWGRPPAGTRIVDCVGNCGSKKETNSNFWVCDDCIRKQNQTKAGKCNICGATTMSEGITICESCVFKRY